MKCDCKDWAESNKEIQRVFTQAHLKGIESYKGKGFAYCPWCRKELGNYEYIEYKPLTIIGKDCQMDARTTSVEEDKAMSSYVRGRYNSTVIPDTDWQVSKGGKYGLGDYKE